MLRLRRYDRISVQNRRFRANGAGWFKISGRRGCPPPTNYSSSRKTRLNVLSYGIKIWIDLSSVLSQSTRLSDRRTDGQTDIFSSLDRVCIPCSAVKNGKSTGAALYRVTGKHYARSARRASSLTHHSLIYRSADTLLHNVVHHNAVVRPTRDALAVWESVRF